MDLSDYKQRSLAAYQLCNNDGIKTVQKLTKPKTINVTPSTHQKLRAYCLANGLKIQAVADHVIQAWLRKAAK